MRAEARTNLDKLLYAAGAVMLMLTIGAWVVLTSSRIHASDRGSAQAAVTISSSCEMTAQVNTAHEALVTPGTYQANIGKTTITALCNDANGYAVYAVGYTNTEFGRNDMLGESTGRTILTGTATAGSTSNWAMKLTSVSGAVAPTITTGYDAYHEIPSEYTKVASYAGSTMTNETGSQFETTFAAFVSSAQVPDTYNGKVLYTLVHPADTVNTPCTGTYTINYNANTGSGNMDSQTVCVDRSISLLPNGFTPPVPVAENKFASWNTEADGSGYTYYPGQSVMNLASADSTVTLYAQWAPKYIQDLTRATCSVVASQEAYTVYDRRDGSDYTVRYIEGACWMTQNLRITGTINKQYSNFSTYDNVNVCEGDLTSGNSSTQARCHDSGNTSNGVWYNYAAASAKTITGSSNDNEAEEDICPAGWHLPSCDTSNAPGSIDSLSSDSATIIGNNLFTPVAGGQYSSGSLSRTGNGDWWSTKVQYSDSRYYLDYDGNMLSVLGTYYYGRRYYGNYIRCVR